MTNFQFRKIISSDNVTFYVPLHNRIFQKTIFRELNQEENILIPAQYLNYIIYNEDIPTEIIPDLLRLIFQFSMTWIEEKCIKKLKKYFKLDKSCEKSSINLVTMIQNYEEPIDFNSFSEILNHKISKSFIINKESILKKIYKGLPGHRIYDCSLLVDYDDFDISIFEISGAYNLTDNEPLLKHILSNMNLEESGKDGLYPIHHIIHKSSPKMIKWIIERNVNLECEDLCKMRPIHYLLRDSNHRNLPLYKLIQLLIDRCIDLESKDQFGRRPIHYACEYFNHVFLEYIIKLKVNLESEDMWKRRPIHYACKYGKIEKINILIENGAEIECKDSKGARSIHYLCKYSNLESIIFLINKGVTLLCIDDEGKYPIDYVNQNRTRENKEQKYKKKVEELMEKERLNMEKSL